MEKMITSVEILGYRAIRYLKLTLSQFHILVGPNGTGKSTFFDAFQLIRDILNVGLERSIFGDSRFLIPQRASDPRDLTWLRLGGPLEIAINLRLPEQIKDKLKDEYVAARYELAINTSGALSFNGETLFLIKSDDNHQEVSHRTLFPTPPPPRDHIVLQAKKRAQAGWRRVISKISESGNDHFRSETSEWNNLFRLGPNKSALSNLPEDEERFPASTWVKRLLMESIHRLALNAEAMRLPSPAGSPREFLPDGANLPWIVHELEEKQKDRLTEWVSHLKTAIDEIDAVRTIERPEDRARYLEVTYKSGLVAPSWLLSDGTLRMMALTLLAYTPTTPNLVLIEEPENGIHPKAIEAVMKSLSSVYDAQVFCATHSPLALSLAKTEDLLCFSKDRDGAIDSIRGRNHPRLREWRSALHLGDLFATGVLG